MRIRGILGWLAEILVLVGALNWGLVGALGFNAVNKLLGAGTPSKIVYIIVGAAALYLIVSVIAFKGDGKKASD